MVSSTTDNKINFDKLSDSSEEEGFLSRIGNVPFQWYNNYEHIGYSVDGTKVISKTKAPSLKSIIQNAKKHKKILIYDELNDQIVELSRDEISMIKKIRHQKPHLKSYDPHPEYNFGDNLIVSHPWRPPQDTAPQIPKETQRALLRLVKAIRNGWLVDPEESARRLERKKREEEQKALLLWAPQPSAEKSAENEYVREHLGKNAPKRFKPYVPIEKAALPGHEESYNPPKECLFGEHERNAYEHLDSEERENIIVPRKIKAMRLIPHYINSIKERYERCAQIYSKPREIMKRRRDGAKKPVEKEKKIDLSKLKPYPAKVGIVFSGHAKRVVSISVSFCGTWLASASEDKTIKIWEIETSRCTKTLNFNSAAAEITKISFSPASLILAVALKRKSASRSPSAVAFLSPEELGIGGIRSEKSDFSQNLFEMGVKSVRIDFDGLDEQLKGEIETELIKATALRLDKTTSIALSTSLPVRSLSWHPKGRHLVLCGDRKPFVVVLKLAPKRATAQVPLRNCRKRPVAAEFSADGRLLFVVFEGHAQIFELSSARKYMQFKTTNQNDQTLAFSISPAGEHLLTGTNTGTVHFFDFEITSAPYRFAEHRLAVLCARFHPTLPLFATASADGEAHVYHYRLPENYASDPEIVAVAKLVPGAVGVGSDDGSGNDGGGENSKRGKGGESAGGGLLECVFHPAQPWVFCCGHSSSVCMFVD